MEGLPKSPKLRRACFNNAIKTKKLTRDCENIEGQRKSFLKEQQVEVTSFLKKLEKSKICASTKVNTVHKNVLGHTKRSATSVGSVIHKATPDSFGKSERLSARQWFNHRPYSEQEETLCNLQSTKKSSDSIFAMDEINNFSNSRNVFVSEFMCKKKTLSVNSADKNEELEVTSLREIDNHHDSSIERPQCLQFDAFQVQVTSNSDSSVKVKTNPRPIQKAEAKERCNVVEGLKYGRCTSSLSCRRILKGSTNLGSSLSLPEIKNKSSSTPCLVTAQTDLDASDHEFETLKRSQNKTECQTWLGNSAVEIRVTKTDDEEQEDKFYRKRSVSHGGIEIFNSAALKERNGNNNEVFVEQDAQVYEYPRNPNLTESLNRVRGLRYLRNHGNRLRRHSTGNPDMDDLDYIWASIKRYSTDNTILGHTKTFF